MRREIYLDHNATTPCDPRVLDVMWPYFTERFGNPSSTTHMAGRQAADALEGARGQVARLFHAGPQDVIFTSGATESNNLALYGVAHAAVQNGDPRRRIVTSRIEHKSVLEPLADLALRGFDVQYVPVDCFGQVDLASLAKLIDAQTLLVTIQAANSEVGTVQPLEQIGALTQAMGAFFHTDATQAVGRVPIDWRSVTADLISLSSHKIYGPKGAGALLARRHVRQGRLLPLLRGGGQESRIRAGTQNLPAMVGFGMACEIVGEEGAGEAKRQSELRDRFEAQLRRELPQVSFNGHPTKRLPNTSSVTIPQLEADALLCNLPLLALSLGSACNAGALEPSYVLTEMGMTRELASSTFRLSVGKATQLQEITAAADEVIRAVRQLQAAR